MSLADIGLAATEEKIRQKTPRERIFVWLLVVKRKLVVACEVAIKDKRGVFAHPIGVLGLADKGEPVVGLFLRWILANSRLCSQSILATCSPYRPRTSSR